MKVCVYAICKNEIKFAQRWMDSMSEADEVYVLDTGSTDGTPEALAACGAKVKCQHIFPWRFDTARNISLEMLPEDTDICVCADLDEVFQPGWRERLEKCWKPGVKRLRCRCACDYLPGGREGTVSWRDIAHSRYGFKWGSSVYQDLEYTATGPYITDEAVGVQLKHLSVPSKSRGQYLPLSERPDDDRNMYCPGREYMLHGLCDKCAETLQEYLAMPSAAYCSDRCASMRNISRAMSAEGRHIEAFHWLLKAIAEAPHLREPWLEAAEFAGAQHDYIASLFFATEALKITQQNKGYINESSWGERPYDLAAVASYHLGRYDDALEYGKKALEIAPDDPRLMSNLVFYKSAVKK